MGCHELVGPGNNETDKPIYPPERGRDRGLGFPGASPAPCMRLLPHVLHAVVTAELQECCAESRLLAQSCKNDFLSVATQRAIQYMHSIWSALSHRL